MGDVCQDFFHAMDFGSSEHSDEKVHEVYILSGLSWSVVSIGTEAASYKRLFHVSLILRLFHKLSGTFMSVFKLCSTLDCC